MDELLRRIWRESLMYALSHVRTRRFGLGYRYDTGESIKRGNVVIEYPKGPMEYRSARKPVPLSDIENALLAWAGAGPTGLIKADLGLGNNVGTFIYITGRTIPAPDNDQGLDLVFIKDDGVYFYRPPQAREIYEIKGEDDLWKIMHWYKHAIKLGPGRTDMAGGLPFTMAFNKNFNEEGSTVFLPIYDYSKLLINILFHIFEYEGVYIIDERTGEVADHDGSVRRLIDEGKLSSQIPITMDMLDRAAGAVAGVVTGASMQNIRLMGEVMGIGIWSFGGIVDYAIMGALAPSYKGLAEVGAVICPPPEGRIWPYKVGIRGVKMSLSVIRDCPDSPYKSGEELVKAFLELKYGRYREPDGSEYEGIWSPSRMPETTPWKPNVYIAIRERVGVKDEIRAAVTSVINYTIEKYGAFPRVDPIWIPMVIQAHHVDPDFYRKYYRDEVLTEKVIKHFEVWHSDLTL